MKAFIFVLVLLITCVACAQFEPDTFREHATDPEDSRDAMCQEMEEKLGIPHGAYSLEELSDVWWHAGTVSDDKARELMQYDYVSLRFINDTGDTEWLYSDRNPEKKVLAKYMRMCWFENGTDCYKRPGECWPAHCWPYPMHGQSNVADSWFFYSTKVSLDGVPLTADFNGKRAWDTDPRRRCKPDDMHPAKIAPGSCRTTYSSPLLYANITELVNNGWEDIPSVAALMKLTEWADTNWDKYPQFSKMSIDTNNLDGLTRLDVLYMLRGHGEEKCDPYARWLYGEVQKLTLFDVRTLSTSGHWRDGTCEHDVPETTGPLDAWLYDVHCHESPNWGLRRSGVSKEMRARVREVMYQLDFRTFGALVDTVKFIITNGGTEFTL